MLGADWYRSVAENKEELGILRLAWIIRNQELDMRDQVEWDAEVAKMHGFWTNPQWFHSVTSKQADGEKNMRFGKTTIVTQTDFDQRLQATLRGEDMTRDPRMDVAERVKSGRGRKQERRDQEVDDALVAEEVPHRR